MKKSKSELLIRVLNGLTFIILILITSHIKDLKSQDFSTRGEIYDYEVGDVFHYNSEAFFYGNKGFQDVTNIEIIGKYYSDQQDTINYIRAIQNKRRELNNGNFGSWEYSYFNDSISYDNLDSIIFICYDFQCNTYSDSNYYNGRLINRYFKQNIGENIYEKYVVGCGRAEYKLSLPNSYGVDSALVYYKKGNEEWGQQLIVGISDQQNNEEVFEIYPNPTESNFQIKYNKLLIGNVLFYSPYGELVDKIHLNNDTRVLDISGLKPNIYILEFNLIDRVIVKKLVKK